MSSEQKINPAPTDATNPTTSKKATDVDGSQSRKEREKQLNLNGLKRDDFEFYERISDKPIKPLPREKSRDRFESIFKDCKVEKWSKGLDDSIKYFTDNGENNGENNGVANNQNKLYLPGTNQIIPKLKKQDK
jgi:hypothetical protein